MRPHKIGGILKNNPEMTCFVFVSFNPREGTWVEVPKAMIRDLVTIANEDEVEDVEARWNEQVRELFVGCEPAAPVESIGADEEE